MARGNEPHLYRQPGNTPDRDIPTHYAPTIETTGWHPTCKCEPEDYELGEPMTYAERMIQNHHPWAVAPCVVLDIFGGSGTVGMVSRALGRKSILIDLSPDYCKQMLKRATAQWDREDEPVADVPAEGLWTA